MAKNASGGETDLLAKAMRTVFSEAVKGATEPLHEDMKGLRTDMQGMGARRGYQDNQRKHAISVRRAGGEDRTAPKKI